METFLYVFLGVIAFFLLLGILLPIFLLIKGLVFGYKKLDEKWEKEAALYSSSYPKSSEMDESTIPDYTKESQSMSICSIATRP